MINIDKILKKLSMIRPVFNSEADFQFNFAWQLKLEYPEADIRLEYINNKIKDMHIDIFILLEGKVIPIELKYKTKSCTCIYMDEDFHLKNHAAQLLGRYDFIRDIERIERCKSNFENFCEGYAIMITNDSSYYNVPISTKETICDDFRIHHNKILPFGPRWKGNPSIGTTKGREKEMNFTIEHCFKWEEYSKVEDIIFKIVKIKII
ncbi:MAG: hypothetical protein RR425_00585 [Erysipelotrichales bacterium]